MSLANRNPFAERLAVDHAAELSTDHRIGLLGLVSSVSARTLKNNMLGLTKRVKLLGLSMILTTGWAQGPNRPTTPELVELFPENKIIDRSIVNACEHTLSIDTVKMLGRNRLIIAAPDPTACRATGAVCGVQDGCEVDAVVDVSDTFDTLNEPAAMHPMVSAGVVVRTRVPTLAGLCSDATVSDTDSAGRSAPGRLPVRLGWCYPEGGLG